MKKSTITLITMASSAVALLSSCSLDPGYKAYKAQQQAATAASTATSAVASATNPYGVPQASGQVGSYTPYTPSVATGGEAPYQPIPGVSTTPSTYIPSTTTTPTIPSIATSGSNYTIVPGDSLWKISRQFGTTVEAIQAANSMTTTAINAGQTLLIPGN